MGDLFFFMRVMFLTAVAVLLMQIRWGSTTIENHAMNFISSSSVVKPVDDAASGVVIFVRNTWSRFTKNINTNFSNALKKDNQPGQRQSFLNMERSEQYVREHEPEIREAKNTATNYFDQFKQKASNTTKKIRGQFVDETVVPGDTNRASSTGDDDDLIEE